MRLTVNINYDQRGHQRFIYEAPMWHENILPGRFYMAKIGNVSRKGIYFESDQALYRGEKIYIGSNRPQSEEHISNNCAGVEIKWRKVLKGSSFRYGYGAEFLDSDNVLVKSIDYTKIIIQNNHGTSGRYKRDPRKHFREIYGKAIVFATKNQQCNGSISNISRGGAFITTNNKFSLGQMIQIDIREDKTCDALRLKGWVVRLSPDGVGVKFDRRIRRDRRKKADRRVGRKTIKKEGP
jgi:Tfp pilus assembly protein PilZ